MILLIGAVASFVASGALFVAASWAHQPGFAGDPRVRLLDGGLYAFVLVVAASLLVSGVMMVNAWMRRRSQ